MGGRRYMVKAFVRGWVERQWQRHREKNRVTETHGQSQRHTETGSGGRETHRHETDTQ